MVKVSDTVSYFLLCAMGCDNCSCFLLLLNIQKPQLSLIVNRIIGPSGVRALPLAAGMNEGGHYFWY